MYVRIYVPGPTTIILRAYYRYHICRSLLPGSHESKPWWSIGVNSGYPRVLLLMRSRRWSGAKRSDISPYLTVSRENDHVRKFQERLRTACLNLMKLFLLPLSVPRCVRRRWSNERHRKSMDFGRERGCGGPYFAAPHARLCPRPKRFEFVELARDISSNCTVEVQARTGISRWYHSFQAVVYTTSCQVHR